MSKLSCQIAECEQREAHCEEWKNLGLLVRFSEKYLIDRLD